MSRSSSSADDCQSSRREIAARAAERRIQANARAIAAAGATTTSGKRRAPVDTSQVQFSDSDDSDQGVTSVGSVKGYHFSGEGSKRGAGGAKKRGRREENASGSMATSRPGTSVGGSKGSSSHTGKCVAAESDSGPRVPKTFRLVSWNIDCLNPENKIDRVQEVCAILLEAEEHSLPDVILFQEVDYDFASILNARLGVGGRYRSYPQPMPTKSMYFTMVYVRVATVTVHESNRMPFPESLMGRDLTSVRCTFNGTPLLVMTSHLESEKQSSDERKNQFSQAIRALLNFREGPAIFAGDTNLREPEVKQEKLVREAGDMWQVCGADPQKRFTWDMMKNDNLVMGFQPRARYDRAYLNPKAKAFAKSFALLGTERMAPPEACFPSDHFGMDCSFEW